jgi:hypothetical protein
LTASSPTPMPIPITPPPLLITITTTPLISPHHPLFALKPWTEILPVSPPTKFSTTEFHVTPPRYYYFNRFFFLLLLFSQLKKKHHHLLIGSILPSLLI